MQVGPVASDVRTGDGVSRAHGSSSMDYDAFLQLLIAQMKNQDPTQPMDSTEYMSQLASFSNVEQAIKANSKLDGLMSALSLSHANALIGRTISSASEGISGEVVAIRIIDGGGIAVLADGKEIPLGSGITIS